MTTTTLPSWPRCLALIPARGGSKGVPRKNVRDVAGRPLIAWTIAAARGSAAVSRTVLSSDNDEIKAVARAWACDVPFTRPPELSGDEARSLDVVRHAMQWADSAGETFDYLILLQPTSPLRTSADIDACVAACVSHGAHSALSVVESAKSPYWMYALDGEQRLSKMFSPPVESSNRQGLPAAYIPNGAVYVARWDHLAAGGGLLDEGVVGYVMPDTRSIDIDTEVDLRVADMLLRDGMAG